jgi:hypothetical protein
MAEERITLPTRRAYGARPTGLRSNDRREQERSRIVRLSERRVYMARYNGEWTVGSPSLSALRKMLRGERWDAIYRLSPGEATLIEVRP